MALWIDFSENLATQEKVIHMRLFISLAKNVSDVIFYVISKNVPSFKVKFSLTRVKLKNPVFAKNGNNGPWGLLKFIGSNFYAQKWNVRKGMHVTHLLGLWLKVE